MIATVMQANEIDALIGGNLRRIREGRGITQLRLAEMISTPQTKLSAYESGKEGMGKDIMARICRALEIEPWEFYITDTTPIVKDEQERDYLDCMRQAEAAGVAEEITRYGRYMVSTAGKDKGGPSSHHADRDTAGKKARVAHHKRRAG